MRHRPGITLVEVLVAIFIMAIAMLALLALFPLGALSMAQALKDDRCATCAVNAEALAVAQDVRHDLLVAGNGTTLNDSFANPFGTVGTLTSQIALSQGAAVPYNGAGYGVLVDPFTYPLDTNGVNQRNVGAVANVTLGTPRRSLAFSVNYPGGRPNTNNTGALSTTEAARWGSMLDGITWARGDNVGANAVPDVSQGSVLRDGRYQWAWLLRRPLWSSDAVIDMSVIIFSGRPGNTAPPDGEVPCTVVSGGAGGSNSVTVQYAGTKPSIRSGGWILDVTSVALNVPQGVTTPPTPQVVYGYPYRVVNATDSGANLITLELQTPVYPAFYPAGSQNYGTGQTAYQMQNVVILEYAVEVFDRGSFVQP